MSGFVSIEVKGLSELKNRLALLPQAIQTKIMKGMVASGAAVIKNEAILRAPYYTGDVQKGHPPPGTLKAAIFQARIVAQSVGTREVWLVSARKGKASKGGMDAYYATWVEYGHYSRGPSGRSSSERKQLSAGSSVPLGSYYILPKPFMRPAFEVKKQEAIEVMRKYMADKLPEAIESTK